MDSKNPTTDLLNILSKAMDSNMYGSVEVYIEDGQITQITQRIIKKIKRIKPTPRNVKQPAHSASRKEDALTLKFQN